MSQEVGHVIRYGGGRTENQQPTERENPLLRSHGVAGRAGCHVQNQKTWKGRLLGRSP